MSKDTKQTKIRPLSRTDFRLEAPPRFELGIKALQASALPLGHGAVFTYLI